MEGFQRDLLLGLWLFSERTESSIAGVLPWEIVCHILGYLRRRPGFSCWFCAKDCQVCVDISLPLMFVEHICRASEFKSDDGMLFCTDEVPPYIIYREAPQ
jgi:hypothetical protein